MAEKHLMVDLAAMPEPEAGWQQADPVQEPPRAAPAAAADYSPVRCRSSCSCLAQMRLSATLSLGKQICHCESFPSSFPNPKTRIKTQNTKSIAPE
jgi:hypothetical protein